MGAFAYRVVLGVFFRKPRPLGLIMQNKRALQIATCAALTLLTLGACRKSATWSDPSPHKSSFVTGNGIRINYLDWGGSGPTIILIHGYADNPHVFDDLAPAFTERFRVIAYAQRGHGDSEAKEPYDTTTLTEDLRGFMDNLGIAKANLAGWSMAGNEITAMAGAHPERIDHMVYLEGAYDWSDPAVVAALQAFPYEYPAPASVMTSLDTFRAFERSVWFPAVADTNRFEAYVRDLVALQDNGTVRPKMSEATAQAVANHLLGDPRDYTKVHSPVLAIFGETFFDERNGDSAQRARHLAWDQKYWVPFRAASIERVRRELSHAEIVNVPGTHMDFLFTSREQVVAAMRRFLGASASQK